MSAFDDLLPAVDERFERLAIDAKILASPGRGARRPARARGRGGDHPRRRGPLARRRLGLPDRLDDQVVHGDGRPLLRDEGRLGLDDPVGTHVPALAGWAPPTADSPAIAIRTSSR
jgi:hypothetical protein